MSRLWFLLILIFLGFSPLIAELFRGGSSRSDKTVWIIFFLVIGSLIAVLTYWLIKWDYF